MSQDLIYERIIRPILYSLDAESVHHSIQALLPAIGPFLPLLGSCYGKDDLKTELFGFDLSNPIGLAAGFDKNGVLISVLGKLGFGFAEIGSICARPHGGNPRPRLFRLPDDRALINRLGLNGLGAELVASNLARESTHSLPLGVNIAKTNDPKLTGEKAVEDLLFTFERVKNLRIKYLTINSSCPNTEEGCIRESETLLLSLEKICKSNESSLPILLKLSPDSSPAFTEELVNLAAKFELAGFVCGNTTTVRQGLQTSAQRLDEIGPGGLSGSPLKALNLQLTEKVFQLKKSEQIIIGVGGIETGQDAFEYLSAGASLLQIYTGFVYRGPFAVKQICEELSQILKQKGLTLRQLHD